MEDFMRKLNLILSLTLVVVATASAADWPQWRGPNRDGVVADATIPAAWPKTLKESWKVTVGVGHSSPVLVNGKIYVFARQGEDETLMCLDAATGKELWRSAQPIAYTMNPAATGHGKGPKATPVVSNGNVYTFGISGVLSCHDANTGKLKWRQEFSKQYSATSPLYGTAMSPLVIDRMVIAHIGGQDSGALTAFDGETGAVKWSNNMDGPAYTSPIVVTLAGVKQIVTAMQKEIVGVDPASGKLLWKLPAKSEYDTNSVTAVVYKDTLVLSREDQGIIAIKLTNQGAELSPQELWTNKDVVLYMNSPVLQANQLYAMTIKNKGQLVSIDADTGKVLWLSPGRMGENAAILNLAGKAILVLTNEARLYVLSPAAKQFEPIAEYTVADSPTWAHPLVTGNRIFVKDETSLRLLSFRGGINETHNPIDGARLRFELDRRRSFSSAAELQRHVDDGSSSQLWTAARRAADDARHANQ
jgi:outer membrane protein assembly factor BamB